jgi:ankyrin repeat protein
VSSQNDYLPVVQYLIQNGADVNQAAANGITPLAFAIYRNQNEVAKLLLKNNANMEITKLDLEKHGELELIAILDKLYKEIKE